MSRAKNPLAGKRYGSLVVVKSGGPGKLVCECDCGRLTRRPVSWFERYQACPSCAKRGFGDAAQRLKAEVVGPFRPERSLGSR